ncbi:hypothetical protein SNE40_014015 [Patella caerulea]|uniref:Uncharacterized protein n=1 Tax=Patella caerulea TaxID=87958 RepID=A0AAN8JET4_PATCE
MASHFLTVLLSLSVVCSLVDIIAGQQAGNSQCQQTFLNNAMKCVQNGSINYNHLTYMTSNGTRGQPPTEGTEAFKARACLSRPTIDACGQMIAATMVNSTMCMNQLEQKQIMLQAASIFGEFDRVCAHPCRYTLMDEFRQCFSYSLNSGMNSQTFLTDASIGRGGIIGMTREQVYQFCPNRQSLMSCMKNKMNMCPDGVYVLQKMNIDIRALEKGLDLLCAHPNVYLAGLPCFTDPTPEVRVCFQNMDMKITQINMLRQQQQLTDQQNYMQMCNVRLEQMECEMGAWRRRQQAPCDNAILGLRNELECKLLPEHCLSMFPSQVQQHCSPMNFYIQERVHYAGATATTVTVSTLITMIIFAIYFME